MSETDFSKQLERQKVYLELIQTIVIVLGLVTAGFGIWDALENRRIAKYEATAKILENLGNENVIQGVAAFNRAASLPKTDENFNLVLAELAPTRQLFLTWAACVSEGICLEGKSRELMCLRIIAYENAAAGLFSAFNKSYDTTKRANAYLGEIERCQKDFGSSEK